MPVTIDVSKSSSQSTSPQPADPNQDLNSASAPSVGGSTDLRAAAQEEKNSTTTATTFNLKQAVSDIYDSLDHTFWFNDTDKLFKTLASLSPAQTEEVKQAFKDTYHQELKDYLKAKLNDDYGSHELTKAYSYLDHYTPKQWAEALKNYFSHELHGDYQRNLIQFCLSVVPKDKIQELNDAFKVATGKEDLITHIRNLNSPDILYKFRPFRPEELARIEELFKPPKEATKGKA